MVSLGAGFNGLSLEERGKAPSKPTSFSAKENVLLTIGAMKERLKV
jgi:hypothetical protein